MQMNRTDRAKQFAPFDALRGLREALAKKEEEHERQEKRELSEEEQAAIEQALVEITRGDEAEAVCFQDGKYVKVVGTVVRVDTNFRYLQIGDGKIAFANLYGLCIVRRK